MLNVEIQKLHIHLAICVPFFRKLLRIFFCYFKVFQKDGYDYFTDMMPALHNYVTVDTPVFLLYENYVLAMFNMCKAVSVLFVFISKHSFLEWHYVIHCSLCYT